MPKDALPNPKNITLKKLPNYIEIWHMNPDRNNSTKKILITGALGHIGSRLIRDISRKAADHLVLIDNFLTQRYASLFDLLTDRRCEFFAEDIMTMDVEKRIKGTDAVIHLAG